MKFDKDEIKNSLSIEQVFDIVADLGGEPRMERDYFISNYQSLSFQSNKKNE